MRESLEELKAIVDNAPLDVEADRIFVCGNGIYWSLNGDFDYMASLGKCDNFEWWVDLQYKPEELPIRSLSDIKRIIELIELNQNMHVTVAGYLYGKDWAHWNEFNAGKFKL